MILDLKKAKDSTNKYPKCRALMADGHGYTDEIYDLDELQLKGWIIMKIDNGGKVDNFIGQEPSLSLKHWIFASKVDIDKSSKKYYSGGRPK